MCGRQYWLVHNFEIKNYIAEIKSAAWEYSPLTVLAALRRLNGIHNIHPWLAECWLTQQTECHADCGHWEAGVSHDPTLALIKYCRDAGGSTALWANHLKGWWFLFTLAIIRVAGCWNVCRVAAECAQGCCRMCAGIQSVCRVQF